ncbi:hypothetical protein G6F65_015430 [Rhizopus arrhizus]|nr:hypothetical protein G6F65_015430 [Rhizopus arrhizus]
MDRVGDDAGVQVLGQRQRLFHQRVRIAQGVVALRHAQLAEVFARGAGRAHVVRGQQREAGVGAAGTVGIHGVLRKARELADGVAEGIHVVGVARDAGHDVRVAGLYGAGRAAQGRHAAGAAHRDVVQPARAHAQMLDQAHGGIGRQRETGHAQAVYVRLGHAGLPDQRAHARTGS